MSRLASGYNEPFKTANNFSEIYVGHTATTHWSFEKDKYGTPIPCTKPIKMGNLWNVDTGAGWDGKLTLMDVDTKEIFQSDSMFTLYPEKLSRKNKKKK